MEFFEKWKTEKEPNLVVYGKPQTQRQFFYWKYWQFFRTEIVPQLPICPAVLEVGCGRGTISQYFKEKGVNLTLVDKESEALVLARKNLGNDNIFVQCEANDLPFGEEFDLVFSMGVAEHIDDIDKFFSEQFRVLKKGGTMVVLILPPSKLQKWNVFGTGDYHRSERDKNNYIDSIVDVGFPMLNLFIDEVNPYPLFTPIPKFLDILITKVYRLLDFCGYKFYSPKGESQGFFLWAKK